MNRRLQTLIVFLLGGVLSVLAVDHCTMNARAYPNGMSGGTDFWNLQSQSFTINPAWQQQLWAIDPSNGTGCASDANNGSSVCGAGTQGPLLTWGELNKRWGCGTVPQACPRIQANTIIEFLSSQTTNADPVYFHPAIERGSQILFEGLPNNVATGISLSSVTAKSRTAGANSLLQAGLGASSAIGQVANNLTHPSYAWIYTNVSGNTWNMTQPLNSVGFGQPPQYGTEVDTWTNGDTITLQNYPQVNLVSVDAMVADMNLGVDSGLGLGQLIVETMTVWDPITPGTSPTYVGKNVMFSQSRIQRNLMFNGNTTPNGREISGCRVEGTIYSSAGTAADPLIVGGALTNNPTFQSHPRFDGDVIIGGAANGAVSLFNGADMGFVYLDNTVNVIDGTLIWNAFGFSTSVVYGAASRNINIQGSSHGANLTGNSYTATFTAPALVTGILLNGSGSACSSSNANSPNVQNCSITTTPAHLDAAQGTAGFGGKALSISGASLANVF